MELLRDRPFYTVISFPPNLVMLLRRIVWQLLVEKCHEEFKQAHHAKTDPA